MHPHVAQTNAATYLKWTIQFQVHGYVQRLYYDLNMHIQFQVHFRKSWNNHPQCRSKKRLIWNSQIQVSIFKSIEPQNKFCSKCTLKPPMQLTLNLKHSLHSHDHKQVMENIRSIAGHHGLQYMKLNYQTEY